MTPGRSVFNGKRYPRTNSLVQRITKQVQPWKFIFSTANSATAMLIQWVGSEQTLQKCRYLQSPGSAVQYVVLCILHLYSSHLTSLGEGDSDIWAGQCTPSPPPRKSKVGIRVRVTFWFSGHCHIGVGKGTTLRRIFPLLD